MKGVKMENEKFKTQINTTIALGIMRNLYNSGEIPEEVYKKIVEKYKGSAIDRDE